MAERETTLEQLLPQPMVIALRRIAAERGVAALDVLKMYLADRLDEELGREWTTGGDHG